MFQDIPPSSQCVGHPTLDLRLLFPAKSHSPWECWWMLGIAPDSPHRHSRSPPRRAWQSRRVWWNATLHWRPLRKHKRMEVNKFNKQKEKCLFAKHHVFLCFWSNRTHINPNAMQELVVMLKHHQTSAQTCTSDPSWINAYLESQRGSTFEHTELQTAIYAFIYFTLFHIVSSNSVWDLECLLGWFWTEMSCAFRNCLISWTRPRKTTHEDIWINIWSISMYKLLHVIQKLEKYGSVSKPCTPGEHQNSW